MSKEPTLECTIRTYASRNTNLLVRLIDVEDAHSNLELHLIALGRLRQSIDEQNVELEKLQQEVDRSFKAHKNFQDSNALPFVFRSAHSREIHQSEMLRAEQAYFAALVMQSKAEERRGKLERELGQAIEAQRPLEEDVKEHDEVRKDIDDLYEKLFGGPTPGFPHEDEAEEAFVKAKSANDAIKSRIQKAREAVRLLTLAEERLPKALEFLDKAEKLGKEVWVFFDDTFNAIKLEYGRVVEAQTAIRATELSQEASPMKEKLLLQLETAKFDPVRGHMHTREVVLSAIISTREVVSEAISSLHVLLEVVKREERDALSEVSGTAKKFDTARQDLQLIRQEIFEKVVGFGKAAPAYREMAPAPEYSTILDEGHEHGFGYCSLGGKGKGILKRDSGVEVDDYCSGPIAI